MSMSPHAALLTQDRYTERELAELLGKRPTTLRHWRVSPVKNGWIGTCGPLKLTVEAETYGELMESISETLDAVLADLMKSVR